MVATNYSHQLFLATTFIDRLHEATQPLTSRKIKM